MHGQPIITTCNKEASVRIYHLPYVKLPIDTLKDGRSLDRNT
jgi:hypothetical protein